MKNKTIKTIAAAVFALMLGGVAQANTFGGITYSTDKDNINLGEWNGNWSEAKTFAEKNDYPMVVLMVKVSCGNCAALESSIASASGASGAFTKWVTDGKGQGLVFVITSVYDDGSNYASMPGSYSAQYKFFGINGTYPFVGVYWPNHNIKTYGSFAGGSAQGVINWVNGKLKDYEYTPYAGGKFVLEPTAGHRYEVEKGTKEIVIDLVRDAAQAKEAVADPYVISNKTTGVQVAAGEVGWLANQTEGQIVIPQAAFEGGKNGDIFTVTMTETKRTMEIPFIEGNSAGNPLWIGEKTADELAYGEWTMDLDVAKTMVENKGGYTLVSVQGSLWCPDCANTERNFLDLTNELGQSKFKLWAESNKVTLVSIDIPNFTDKQGNCTTPCLLSADPYETALARNNYVDKKGNKYASPTAKQIKNKKLTPTETPELTGADPAMVAKTAKSGLGYLTRKNALGDAETYFNRNHKLALDYTAEGGFHRPEDGNANRPGVPIFVLLRQDGTVAGRFTKFASTSPFLADQANFEQYCDRLEELMADADGDTSEIENNDARTTTLELKSGGTSFNKNGYISQADAIDVYALPDAKPGVQLSFKLSSDEAELSGKVTLELQALTNANVKAAVLDSVSGDLKDGIEFEYLFDDEDGVLPCFLAVKADTSDAGFAAESTNRTRLAYSVKSSMVLIPSEAGDSVPVAYDTVGIEIVEGEVYRIEGIKDNVPAELEGPISVGDYDHYYIAGISGVTEVGVTSDHEVKFQTWNPGEVRFNRTERKRVSGKYRDVFVNELKVKENVGRVSIPLARVGGSSGEVMVKLSINTNESENIVINDGEKPHYRWDNKDFDLDKPAYFTWASGEEGPTNFVIGIVNDDRRDGDCKFVFNLDLVSGIAVVTNDRFVLTVTENDSTKAGKVRFAETADDPDRFAKSGNTIYALADPATGFASAKVQLERYDGCDGAVSGALKVASCETSVTNFDWIAHGNSPREIEILNVMTGKTATVSFGKLYGGLKSGSPSSVKVVAIDPTLPKFEQGEYAKTEYRYVAVSNAYKVIQRVKDEDVPGDITKRTLSFSKLSGSLPSGLSASWDKADSLVVKGIPSKAGSYVAYYQVTETVSYKKEGKRTTSSLKVTGYVTRIAITVLDPQVEGSGAGGVGAFNASCAASRTFTDLSVLLDDPAVGTNRLTGTLTLTIPKQTGKVSAKYNCSVGSVSFSSAKSWSKVETDNRNALVAELIGSSSKYKAYKLTVRAFNDGSIAVEVTDPEYPETAETPIEVVHDGALWSKTANASAYQGYYTVALPTVEVVREDTTGFASTGTGYLTLKMNSSSAWNAGKVTWALMLPNGTTQSGSSVLTKGEGQWTDCNGDAHEFALLPVFKRTSTDRFAGVVMIVKDALELSKAEEAYRATVLAPVTPAAATFWTHSESASEANANYETKLNAFGAIFDSANLSGCCTTAHKTNYYDFDALDVTNIVSEKYGPFEPEVLGPFEHPMVRLQVDGSKIVKLVSPYANTHKVTLSYAKSTGIVTGSFYLPYLAVDKHGLPQTKTLSVSYRGIVLSGWGVGCGCGTEGKSQAPFDMPLINGTWYFSDKLEYEHYYISRGVEKSQRKSITVKRGGAVAADPVVIPVPNEGN